MLLKRRTKKLGENDVDLTWYSQKVVQANDPTDLNTQTFYIKKKKDADVPKHVSDIKITIMYLGKKSTNAA